MKKIYVIPVTQVLQLSSPYLMLTDSEPEEYHGPAGSRRRRTTRGRYRHDEWDDEDFEDEEF